MARLTILFGVVFLAAGALSAPAFHPGFELNDIASVEALQSLFTRWRAAHNKPDLDAKELSHRFKIFSDNVRKIHTHNRQNGVTFRMALNKFADLTPQEFKAAHYGLDLSLKEKALKKPASRTFRHAAVTPPKAIDWRTLGAVTNVKDQGYCGSCWAFSTTGAIEGINKIVTGELVSVSEQELVDCDRERDHGCMGGLMDFAFEFVIKNGGLDTEADYGYNATDNFCSLDKLKKHAVTIDDYDDVPENDEIALQKAVAKQPVSVAIEADEASFQFYSEGVITNGCGTDLDHGVLAVGYGREKGVDYWIVKNSWGPHWGDGGYVRLRRNTEDPEGMCGIAMMASFPIKLSDAEKAAQVSVM